MKLLGGGKFSEKRGFFGKFFSQRRRLREKLPFYPMLADIGGGANPDLAHLLDSVLGGEHLPLPLPRTPSPLEALFCEKKISLTFPSGKIAYLFSQNKPLT